MIYRPYEYQRTATKWILQHPRCGLFLDMGLGKTVSTLTAVQQMIDNHKQTRRYSGLRARLAGENG